MKIWNPEKLEPRRASSQRGISDFQFSGAIGRREKLDLPASVAVTAAMPGVVSGDGTRAPHSDPQRPPVGAFPACPGTDLGGRARVAGGDWEVHWDHNGAVSYLKYLPRELPTSTRKETFGETVDQGDCVGAYGNCRPGTDL